MKKISMFLLIAILFSFMAVLTTPVVSYADGLNDSVLNIVVGEKGELTVSGSDFTNDRALAWNTLIGKYKGFIAGISGIGTITMVALFIMQFMKLAASAGNPQARSQALVGVLWTGIAAAGLGAVTMVVGFFYRAI